jgi:hypothetical protein
VSTGLTTKADPSQDSKVEQMLAVSSNKRDLAHRLGVDVYSSNSVLQKEMNSVAWATSLGSLTLSAALAPVGGHAVMGGSAGDGLVRHPDGGNALPQFRAAGMDG